MARFRDSVGNTYNRVPPPKHPPKAGPSKGGKRKIGNKKKKPSAKRYLAERRWETNKARRAKRRAKENHRPTL